MEHTQGVINQKEIVIHQEEYKQASNSYLMAIVSIVAGLPLPIINIIASLIYYLNNLKSSYFVRWHCIQALLAQTVMVPFNSVAVGWTISIILNRREVSIYYGIYLFAVILFNIVDFFAVISTASRVGKGKNVRWFIIANITDVLCSKKNKDPYRI